METQMEKHPFQTKSSQTHKNSEMCISVHKSDQPLPFCERGRMAHYHLRRCRRKRGNWGLKIQKNKKKKEMGLLGGLKKDEGEEYEEVERKIEALQKIVPGGESRGMDKLFEETAGYIVALQYQIKTMRALVAFFDKLEKDKNKIGG